jgi:hypothetical protein
MIRGKWPAAFRLPAIAAKELSGLKALGVHGIPKRLISHIRLPMETPSDIRLTNFVHAHHPCKQKLFNKKERGKSTPLEQSAKIQKR